MKAFTGLRAQLVLLVLLAVAPLAGLWIWEAGSARQRAIEQAQSRLASSAALLAAAEDRIAESTQQLLQVIAQAPDVLGGVPAACQRFFDNLRGRFPAYANVGVLTPQGLVRCSTAPGPGVSAADRAYFREAVAQRRFVAGDYAVGRISGRAVVGFALPVLQPGGDLTGVAFAALDVRAFEQTLVQAGLPEGVRVTLADRRGVVLATHPDRYETPGRPLRDAALREAALAGRVATGEGLDADGARRVHATAPGAGEAGRWFFVTLTQPRSDVLAAQAHETAARLAALLAFGGLGIAAAWWLGGRVVVQPAEAIADVARRIEQGQLDARLPAGTDGGGEFARISAAFNHMAEALQAREQQMQAQVARTRDARDMLDLILNSMQEAVVAADQRGQVFISNAAAARLFSFDHREVVAEDWPAHFGLYHAGTDRLLALQDLPLYHALQGRTGRDLDVEVRNDRVPEGRTVRCSYQPLRTDGRIVGGLTVITDITDIVRLQRQQAGAIAELRELQRKLVEAQAIGEVGNWELDVGTGRLWWSDEVYELFGASRESFDRTIPGLLQIIHPDDRERFVRERERAVEQDVDWVIEYRIVRDGEVRWIHQIGRSYRDADGVTVRRAGVVQDITARQRAEAELVLLRNAVSRLNDVVLITEAGELGEPGPRIVYVNDAFERVTGYMAAEVIGRSPRLLQGPDTDRATLDRIRLALERQHPVRAELVNYSKSGQPYWLEIEIAPVHDERGMCTHFVAVERDVTARKAAEQALIASERRYAALFDQSPLPMWVYDLADNRFLAVNDATVLRYGYSREEFAAMTLYDIRPASQHAALRERLANWTEPTTGRRWIHRASTGHEFTVEVTARPVRYGDRDALFVVAIDISDRLASERDVQGYIESLQRLNDTAQALMQPSGIDAVLGEAAAQGRALLGARAARVALVDTADADRVLVDAVSGESVTDGPLPDLARLVREGLRPLRAAGAAGRARHWLGVPLIGSGGQYLGRIELIGKQEGEFTPRDEYVALELAHLVTAAVEKARLLEEVRLLNTDLESRIALRTAELARQEAIFRALADQAPQLVWMVEEHAGLTYMNERWLELVGVAAQECLGARWMRFVHPDDLPAVLSNWRESLATGLPFAGVRRIRGADGRYRTMAYRAVRVNAASGEAGFWVGIDADITELKSYEEALRRSNEELEAFSYSVSHDLRAPLQAVDGFVRLLMRELGEAPTARAAHYGERVQSGVRRMSELIDDLLSLARVSRAAMRLQPVNASALAREVAADLRAAHPHRSVTLRVQDGIVVDADPQLLRVVLENLMGNAWKFTAREVEARVEVGRREDGACYVRDNGAGFDMAYADKLFTAFHRLHSEREFPGTGIGLATVKRILERHHGTVWAESAEGQGATFWFTLPVPPARAPRG